MRILLTGATGLIGKKLGQALVRAGHELLVVSRQADAQLFIPFPCEVIQGDLSRAALTDERLAKVEAVIHLAGENVGQNKWSPEVKKAILESRTQGTKNLWKSLESAPLKVAVVASAIGFYGDLADEELSETSNAGEGFLAQVSQEWEKALLQHGFPNLRLCIIRLGVVLSEEGGALGKMIPLARKGLGAALGNGQQWMSWIHIQDVVGLFSFALENEKLAGVVNAVAPNPVRNAEFSKALSENTGTFLGPNVPRFALKLVLGEQAEMVLASQRVSCARILSLGYRFAFPELNAAMASVCGYVKSGDELFVAEQYLDSPLEQVFPFFAEAKNLETITPPLVNFKIIGMSTPTIQKGSLIDYSLKIHGVPVKWRTDITTWDPPREFVDEQLKGPYSKWHHTHSFEKLGRGTLMRDRVLYRVPLGFLGALTTGWLVRKDVEEIFSFRRRAVAQI